MWEKAFTTDELPKNSARCFSHGAGRIGVFHTEEGFFAIDNTCPHASADLHEGELLSDAVRCPWHRWRFNLRTGKCATGPQFDAVAYPVKEEAGAIWINVAEGKRPERE